MTDATICQSLIQLPSEDQNEQGCLVRIYPPEGLGGMWTITDDELFIGRSPDCAIQLDGTAISRRHAAIQRVDDGFMLVDLQSTNGTQVNDQTIQQHLLKAGDRIRIGTYIFKYLSHDDIERQYHETVYKMTTTDGLTRAYNRQYLEETLDREILRSLRHQRPLAVLMLDIDHFKQVNDQYGHLAGDDVLQEFCRRVREQIEADDLVARYGGEEFCVILSECHREQALSFAEELRLAVAARPFATLREEIPVTVSIGVHVYSGESPTTVSELIDAADQRLYEAKTTGRNRVR